MSFLKSKSFLYVIVAFFMFSWPFIHFPITDGDVNNWTDSAFDLAQHWQWLTGASDQAHGPLIVWGTAVFIWLLGPTLYAVNALNLVFSIVGVLLTAFFARKFWNNPQVTSMACFLYVSCLGTVYLSRTPMYDWPAAICFFAFCGFYTLYAREGLKRFFVYALCFLALGSLSRFSICLGLAGFYIFFVSWYENRLKWQFFIDGVVIVGVIVLANFPWFMGQVSVEGGQFLKEFLYDNTGRYFKSTRSGATFRFDFYGFSIYVLLGLIPFTFMFLATLFKKGLVAICRREWSYIHLCAGFLPALILFSFSGHTKLARYIAYVFPFIFMLMAHGLVTRDLKDPVFIHRCKTMIKWVAGILGLLLLQQGFQFYNEVNQSVLFVCSIVGLLYGLLGFAYYALTKGRDVFMTAPERLLVFPVVLYGVFFTILTYESRVTPFLYRVTKGVLDTLQ